MQLPSDRKINVYADYNVINQNLHHPKFQVVDNMQEADVLWLMSHFKDFRYVLNVSKMAVLIIDYNILLNSLNSIRIFNIFVLTSLQELQ